MIDNKVSDKAKSFIHISTEEYEDLKRFKQMYLNFFSVSSDILDMLKDTENRILECFDRCENIFTEFQG